MSFVSSLDKDRLFLQSGNVRYILSLDQGTTSSRAILYDHDANVVAVGQREFQQIFPRSGWVEHDADEIWASQWNSIEQAFKAADCAWEDVSTIGITNQRETVVFWDKETSKPLANAIVWQDRRGAEICGKLKKEGREAFVRERTGLLLDPYFSGSKIKWLMSQNDEARKLADAGRLAIGTIDAWLVWKLSGGNAFVTDVSNASRTLLLDIHSVAWDDDLLALFDAPRSALPEVVDSSGNLAMTDMSITEKPIPICGIAGDQQAALFGQQCFSKGDVKSTYGTGCFILMNQGSEVILSSNRLLTTIAWRMNGEIAYALEGSVFIGGAVTQWLRDQLEFFAESEEIEALAKEVEDSGDVVLVPAFAGLGAPHWDPYARGALFGLTRGSSKAHIARAALDAVAFQVVEVVEAMENDSGHKLESLNVDGGACANGLLMQRQADLLNCEVRRPKNRETTALGAALLAGLGIGIWKEMSDLNELFELDAAFQPKAREEEVHKARKRWDKAVDRCRNWIEDEE